MGLHCGGMPNGSRVAPSGPDVKGSPHLSAGGSPLAAYHPPSTTSWGGLQGEEGLARKGCYSYYSYSRHHY